MSTEFEKALDELLDACGTSGYAKARARVVELYDHAEATSSRWETTAMSLGAQLERANAEIEKFRSFPRGEENARLETRALAAEQERDRLRTEMEWAVKQCYRQTSPTGAICASIVQQGLNAALRAPDGGVKK